MDQFLNKLMSTFQQIEFIWLENDELHILCINEGGTVDFTFPEPQSNDDLRNVAAFLIHRFGIPSGH